MTKSLASPRAPAPTLVSLESLAQARLIQIADAAYDSLSGRTKYRATLRQILNDALDAMNELSAVVETAGV